MPASEQTLRAVIEIADRATGPLAAIAGRFRAFEQNVAQVGRQVRRLGEETGIARLGERFRGASEHAHHLNSRIGQLFGPLAALGSALSVGGFAEALKGAAEYDEKLDLAAKATGLHAQELAGWGFAAKLAGVDQEELNKGIQRFNINIAEAARGKAKDVELIFQRMGLSNTPGHMLDTAAGLRAVAAETQKLVGSGQVQLATDLLAKLYGARRGARYLSLFAQGPGKIDEQFAEARRHGLMQTDAQIAAGHKFADSFKQADEASHGLFLSIADRLYPTLTPLVERFTKWVDANREWIATGIGDKFKQLVDTLKDVDFEPVWSGLRAVGSVALWALDHLRLVEIGLGALAVIRLVGVIGSVGALGVAGRIAAGATGVGLIGLAAYEIYENWDTIEPLLERVFNNLGAAGAAAFDRISKAAKDAVDYWDSVAGPAIQNWIHQHAPWLEILPGLGGGGASGRTSAPLGPGPAAGPLTGGRAAAARSLFAEAQARGLDAAHATAMIANAYAESGLNSAALGDYQNGVPTSFGLFQEHDSRMRDMLRTLGNRAKDPLAQLDYAIDEQRRRDPGWFGRSGSARDLTNSFQQSFERAAGNPDRSSFADRISAALATPIRPAVSTPAAQKGKIDVNVRVDHRNPPPGATARATASGGGDYDFGNLGSSFAF